MNTFGERLRWAMDRSGHSCRTLAREIGTTHQSVHGWTSYGSEPRGGLLLKAADVLHLDPRWLIFGGQQTQPERTHATNPCPMCRGAGVVERHRC